MPKELSPLKIAIRTASRKLAHVTHARVPMRYPTYSPEVAERIERYHDDIRYSTLALAIERICRENVQGALSEVGVYQGATSLFIHKQVPDRKFYLFDTFEGFPDKYKRDDGRFCDTSQESVKMLLGDSPNLHFRKGFFPSTAVGLEDEMFALVMLDVDIYQSAFDVFSFFYPRLVRGAYFFMHDFNSPESDGAIAKAAHEFMADKLEMIIEIPDYSGSALFRKI